MKKAISLILVFVLCLSLCACGGAKMTTAMVEEALADCDGTLNMETSDDTVTGFTFVVEDVNADDLVDKDYSREAIKTLLTGDTSQITFGQYKVCTAFSPLMSIYVLLDAGSEDEFDSDAFIEELLDIVCSGKTAQYNGWNVSAQVDQSSDSVTVTVVSQ